MEQSKAHLMAWQMARQTVLQMVWWMAWLKARWMELTMELPMGQLMAWRTAPLMGWRMERLSVRLKAWWRGRQRGLWTAQWTVLLTVLPMAGAWERRMAAAMVRRMAWQTAPPARGHRR